MKLQNMNCKKKIKDIYRILIPLDVFRLSLIKNKYKYQISLELSNNSYCSLQCVQGFAAPFF